jgi:exopolysaccharide production protein ExoZ
LSSRLLWLEAGRGVASLAVGLVHAAAAMAPPQYSGREGANGIFHYGFLGVDFFFVLSGFIIMHAYGLREKNSISKTDYVVQRLFRILPVYWVCLVLMLIVNQFQRSKIELSLSFLANEFFLTTSSVPWLGAAWTLQYEFLFYIMFITVLINRTFGLCSFVLWGVIIVGYSLATPQQHLTIYDASWLDRVLSPQNLEFLFGVSISIYARSRLGRAYLATTLSIIVLVGAYFLTKNAINLNENMNLYRTLFVGGIFGLIVLGLCLIDQFKIPAPKVLLWLGRVSFSFYLIHALVFGLVYAVLAKLGLYSASFELALIALVCAIGLGISHGLYFFVENPALKVGKRFQVRPSIK